jgi:phosphoglycerate dehydrogenase-like enzyme
MRECEATQEMESTAIVTGLASGIGRATGERLRDAGWRVIGIDLRDEAPQGTELLVGDAADDRVLESALGRADGLRGLVCAAGLPPHGPWDDEADWDAVIHTDLTAPYRMSDTFDLVIIGAGEAGQAAAYEARRRGASVAIIDRELFGGSAGMQDFKIPAAMTANAMSYHTVVLWDTAMKHAIAAAPLVLK